MDIRIFTALPKDAAQIRTEVFVEEQGFTAEFDENDDNATHIVGYIEGQAVATARVIGLAQNEFLIGRIAVLRNHRKQGLGAVIISEAEKIIRQRGGNEIYIHAQVQAVPFYEKQGYCPTGEKDEEEGCPHWMLKKCL